MDQFGQRCFLLSIGWLLMETPNLSFTGWDLKLGGSKRHLVGIINWVFWWWPEAVLFMIFIIPSIWTLMILRPGSTLWIYVKQSCLCNLKTNWKNQIEKGVVGWNILIKWCAIPRYSGLFRLCLVLYGSSGGNCLGERLKAKSDIWFCVLGDIIL